MRLDLALLSLTACLALSTPAAEIFAPPIDNTADNANFDVTTGMISGTRADLPNKEIQKKLPFFSGECEEGSIFNFGGGVFYLPQDFFFYTLHDMVEFRTDCEVQNVPPLFKATREEYQKMFGNPTWRRMPPEGWFDVYRTAYGSLAVARDARGKVALVRAYFHGPKGVVDHEPGESQAHLSAWDELYEVVLRDLIARNPLSATNGRKAYYVAVNRGAGDPPAALREKLEHELKVPVKNMTDGRPSRRFLVVDAATRQPGLLLAIEDFFWQSETEVDVTTLTSLTHHEYKLMKTDGKWIVVNVKKD